MSVQDLLTTKSDALQKALHRQEGAYVPNMINNNCATIAWVGKTATEVIYDPQKYAQAVTAVFDEMWVDSNLLCGATFTPRRDEAFPMAENRYGPDGTTPVHLQIPPMQADEYDQLIANPGDFIANVLLPRKFEALYKDRDAFRQALKVYTEDKAYSVLQMDKAVNSVLKEKYGVLPLLNMRQKLNTPLDHLFDFFRGFRGTLTDLRRQSAKVQAAIDAIWEYRWTAWLQQPIDPAQGCTFQPCHIPAYLSPKQFEELYWPYEKQLIEHVAACGGKAYIILEGRWERIVHHFLELPKDCCILHVDDDDFLQVHQVLGHHQILCGGLKSADTLLKPIDRIKDDIKRVIDTCAPGGGFLFSTDKAWITPSDMNRNLVDAYNFAHEYSSK